MTEVKIRAIPHIIEFSKEYVELMNLKKESYAGFLIEFLKNYVETDEKSYFGKDVFIYNFQDTFENNYDIVSAKFSRGDYGIIKSTFSSKDFTLTEDIKENYVVPVELYVSFIPYSENKILFIFGNFKAFSISGQILKSFEKFCKYKIEIFKKSIFSLESNDDVELVFKKYDVAHNKPFSSYRFESEIMLDNVDSIRSVEIIRKHDEHMQKLTSDIGQYLNFESFEPTVKYHFKLKNRENIHDLINSFKKLAEESQVQCIKVNSDIVNNYNQSLSLTFRIDKNGTWIPISYPLSFESSKLNLKNYSKALLENRIFQDTFENLQFE
ncbi:hypothetical protein [Methanococcus maripaludis]|uniref:Uncharacterized protein n=1 Tax=Methanococcus maripaludis TaxID=39152 RepID=A0A7J9S385_METMI|nr:hypothetical protein [Methanococcus maripaludis]MBB6067998.1 hypothetical protein [Methanococcus maripaludis]